MDELLHKSKPAGALRTGTSSSTRVKAQSNKYVDDVEFEKNEKKEQVDRDDLTAAERALDDESQDNEQLEVEVVRKTVALESDDSSLPTIESNPTNLNKPKSALTSITPSNPPIRSTQNSDQESDKSKPLDSKNKLSESRIKKKTPARQVKPGTLANAIATASKDSVERSTTQISGKASCSADRDALLTEAACIRSERHPHQKEAIAILNIDCEEQFPDKEEQMIAIDMLEEEREAALFVSLEKMRCTLLKRQVIKQKKLLE